MPTWRIWVADLAGDAAGTLAKLANFVPAEVWFDRLATRDLGYSPAPAEIPPGLPVFDPRARIIYPPALVAAPPPP